MWSKERFSNMSTTMCWMRGSIPHAPCCDQIVPTAGAATAALRRKARLLFIDIDKVSPEAYSARIKVHECAFHYIMRKSIPGQEIFRDMWRVHGLMDRGGTGQSRPQ